MCFSSVASTVRNVISSAMVLNLPKRDLNIEGVMLVMDYYRDSENEKVDRELDIVIDRVLGNAMLLVLLFVDDAT